MVNHNKMGKRGGQKLNTGGGAVVQKKAQVTQAQVVAPEGKKVAVAAGAGFTDADIDEQFGYSDYSEIQDGGLTARANMTPAEKVIAAYTSSGSYKINAAIVNNQMDGMDATFKKYLNASLDTLPVYKQTGDFLYRGHKDRAGKFKNVAVGDEFTLSTFTSTSKKKEKAQQFYGDYNDSPVLFQIKKSKSGRDINKISSFPHEQEVLFKTDTKWKVTGVETVDHHKYPLLNVTVITIEEL